MRIFISAVLALTAASCTPSRISLPNRTEPLENANASDSWCPGRFENSHIKEVDIVELASALHGGDYKKREFESTADYEHRLADRLERAKQIVKKKTGGTELVFSVPIPEDRTQYNADTEVMTIGREYSGLLPVEYSSVGSVIVAKSSQRAVGTYIGENAFGVKRRITRLQAYSIGFNAPEGSISGWPSTLGTKAFKPINIKIPRDEARKAKENLAVVFSGALRPPYLATGTDRLTPKIDAPFDRTTVTQAVQLDIYCAAVYNKSRGEIIQSIY